RRNRTPTSPSSSSSSSTRGPRPRCRPHSTSTPMPRKSYGCRRNRPTWARASTSCRTCAAWPAAAQCSPSNAPPAPAPPPAPPKRTRSKRRPSSTWRWERSVSINSRLVFRWLLDVVDDEIPERNRHRFKAKANFAEVIVCCRNIGEVVIIGQNDVEVARQAGLVDNRMGVHAWVQDTGEIGHSGVVKADLLRTGPLTGDVDAAVRQLHADRQRSTWCRRSEMRASLLHNQSKAGDGSRNTMSDQLATVGEHRLKHLL